MLEICYKRLGKAIKKLRIRRKLKQETLAIRMHVSRATLANMEVGRQRIHLHHLLKLEKLLKDNKKQLMKAARK